MVNTHIFKASVSWPVAMDRINTAKTYSKSHSISIAGKAILSVSSAKAFKGDPALHNPEDLLLSSLMSCHMMSYLYVCGKQGIEVLNYSDQAEATLESYADGSGKITEVRLYPKVTISDSAQIPLALSLHIEANKLCFIANSCNFPVHHQAICVVSIG